MYDFLDKIGLKAVLEAIKGKMPASLPANGGNADTVDGRHADDFIKSVTDINRTSLDDCVTGGTYAVSPVYTTDIPTQYGMWGICDVRVYGMGVYQIIQYTDTANVICRSKIVSQTDWTEWKEISTTPIKSTGWITSPTDQYGSIILPNSSTRVYLSITALGYYAELFSANNEYNVHITNGNYEKIINTPISYNAFYIE